MLEDASGRRPWSVVLEAARVLARELENAHGPLAGSRILLQGEPSAAWAQAFFAILGAGGIVVPVTLGAPSPELRYFAEDAGARLAVVTHDGPTAFESIEVVVASKLRHVERASRPTSTTTSSVTDGEDGVERPSASDPALLLYTSGTTGKPKGALISHANLATQARILREAWDFRETDVLVHTLPMHHLHGIVVAFLTAATTPATIVMLPRFDARRVMQELERATVFMAVPTMYQRLIEAVDAAEPLERERFANATSRLRLATSGSAALPKALALRWKSMSGSIPLERYGMTEIGMALSNSLDPEGRRAGAVGRPLPTVEIRIVDELGSDCDGPGELWVRGPSVFSSYFGRSDATTTAFRDGWFMTGDVAVRDAEGVIRLLGRSSVDILKSGGEKVSALEIEEVLREHPAIREIAVIGLTDEVWGERVVAAVVAHPGRERECEEDLVRAWAKSRLSPFKVPREVRLLPSLPRNAMGKVLKPEITQLLSSLPRIP